MLEYLFAFLVGGVVTTLITYLEISGLPLLSGLAALFPIFTWLSYLFIGNLDGPNAVSRHSLFVLLGTIVAWIPYMFVIYFLAPRLGSGKAILLGLAVFIVLATIFVLMWNKTNG